MVQFDAAAYFDQFLLENCVRDFNGFQGPDGKWYASKVLTMGFKGACDVAQATSEAVSDFEMNDTDSLQYVDNFCFGDDNRDQLVRVAKIFLARCKAAGIILNSEEIIITDSFDCLGEHFAWMSCATGDLACMRSLTESTMSKLDAVRHLIVNIFRRPTTARQTAAIFGVLFFANGVVGAPSWLARTWNALRHFRHVAAGAEAQGWDSLVPPPTFEAATELLAWCSWLQKNIPVPNSPDEEHTTQPAEITIFTDASEWGFGAVAIVDGCVRVLSRPWSPGDRVVFNVASSAVAEPLAVLRCAQHFVEGGKSRVQIFSDHLPFVFSCGAGYGKSFMYNKVILDMNRLFPFTSFFISFIPGRLNPADPYSRGKWGNRG